MQDLKHIAKYARLPRNREKIVLERTVDAFSTWHQTAKEPARYAEDIARSRIAAHCACPSV